MPRPVFEPDPDQSRTIRELGEAASAIGDAELRRTALIAKAYEQGVPIEHIAQAAVVEVEAVYRKLGRPLS